MLTAWRVPIAPNAAALAGKLSKVIANFRPPSLVFLRKPSVKPQPQAPA
jgi:hypothetical protein